MKLRVVAGGVTAAVDGVRGRRVAVRKGMEVYGSRLRNGARGSFIFRPGGIGLRDKNRRGSSESEGHGTEESWNWARTYVCMCVCVYVCV